MLTQRITGKVLGTPIEVTNFDRTSETILSLARLGKPAYVCFATAHMLVEASRDAVVERAYRDAAMIAPDGAPVAWCLRLKGHREAMCVSGPRTMPLLLKAAHAAGLRVGFYGGRPETLELMKQKLAAAIPGLKISYSYSPPFREPTIEEQSEFLRQVSEARVQLLFIGLGSPKQERWMQKFSPSLHCVCLGVGAAFEFLSGEKILPPVWIQKMGMTWFVRLCQEPRRLARRNLCSFIFVRKALQDLVAERLASPRLPMPSVKLTDCAYVEPDQNFAQVSTQVLADTTHAWEPLISGPEIIAAQRNTNDLSEPARLA